MLLFSKVVCPRDNVRIFSNLLVSFQAFALSFGKKGVLVNDPFAQSAHLAGKQNAQQQAGLPDGVDNLRRPVGLCIIVAEFVLAEPPHKAHKSQPGHEK